MCIITVPVSSLAPLGATWWRHQMETFSALLAICAGNSPVAGEFPTQRPVTRSFDIFFDLRLNKRLSKQSWGWWFETLSRPLWRHHNVEQKWPLEKYIQDVMPRNLFSNELHSWNDQSFLTCLQYQICHMSIEFGESIECGEHTVNSDSLIHSDTTWRHRTWSTLVQVINWPNLD